MTECLACRRVAIWFGVEMVYPSTRSFAPALEEMPGAARELHEEAAAVYPHSKPAAAARARAALERLLRATGVDGGRLDDLIANVRPRVPLHVWQLLSALRVTGNTGLHASPDSNELIAVFMSEQDADIARAMLEAVNPTAAALIGEPARANRIYGLIRESRRAAAEQKIEGLQLPPEGDTKSEPQTGRTNKGI